MISDIFYFVKIEYLKIIYIIILIFDTIATMKIIFHKKILLEIWKIEKIIGNFDL